MVAPASPARIITASPAPGLGAADRRRPVGRIGGIVGSRDEAAAARLAACLGAGAQILSGGGSDGRRLVADWDASWLEGEPVRRLQDWSRIVATGALPDVDGAFALAWLDADGTLSLARDGVGERTLYYARAGGALVFASTLHAVLATGLVDRSVSLPSLAAYLAYAYVPGRGTLVAGVEEVLPGEIVSCRDGRVTRRRLWSIPAESEAFREQDEAGLVARLRAGLEAAVRRRLAADEPVGAFLSGGLDSSLVVALARRFHAKPVITYSVSFGTDYPNELAWSSLVAAHCGTEHRIVEVSAGAALAHLDDAIALLSEPIGDPLTVPNALLFREAAREVGVVLNGEGGDPCFGGPKNLPMVLAELLGDGRNTGAHERHARERSYLRAHQKLYDDLGELLTADVRAAVADDPLEARLTDHLADPRWSSFVTRLMALNVTFKGAHHILPKVDAVSAGFGVLARSPLFDRGVVELAFAMPPELKLRGAVEKHALKQAVHDLLPRAIVERPKSGMLVPVEAWFRGSWRAPARERLLDGLARYRLFEPRYLETLLAGKIGGLRPRRGAKLWLLVTLEAWLRRVLDAR